MKSRRSSTRADAALPDEVWSALLGAVATRLRSVAARAADGIGAAAGDVNDCACALDRVQDGLRDAAQRHLDGRRDLLDVHVALAEARAELALTRASERQAHHLAQHDSLTALPDRATFNERLDAALREADGRGPPLAVLFVDLDGFKPINDLHGHATGDELLRIVASRLSHSIRAGDLVCRFGGDEFACVLFSVKGREQVDALAAKLYEAVSAPLQVGTLTLRVRPSIGIAIHPADGDTATGLLTRADTAMYRAKRHPLGHVFFDGRDGG